MTADTEPRREETIKGLDPLPGGEMPRRAENPSEPFHDAQAEPRRLGRTQRLVLHLLASQPDSSARDLSYHWPSLSESAAMSAVNRLADRGFVDMGRGDFRRGRFSRTFVLTRRGADVERSITALDEGDDDA